MPMINEGSSPARGRRGAEEIDTVRKPGMAPMGPLQLGDFVGPVRLSILRVLHDGLDKHAPRPLVAM